MWVADSTHTHIDLTHNLPRQIANVHFFVEVGVVVIMVIIVVTMAVIPIIIVVDIVIFITSATTASVCLFVRAANIVGGGDLTRTIAETRVSG